MSNIHTLNLVNFSKYVTGLMKWNTKESILPETYLFDGYSSDVGFSLNP